RTIRSTRPLPPSPLLQRATSANCSSCFAPFAFSQISNSRRNGSTREPPVAPHAAITRALRLEPTRRNHQRRRHHPSAAPRSEQPVWPTNAKFSRPSSPLVASHVVITRMLGREPTRRNHQSRRRHPHASTRSRRLEFFGRNARGDGAADQRTRRHDDERRDLRPDRVRGTGEE